MLNATPKGEMDAATMGRLLPEYNRVSTRRALWRFHDPGIIRSRRFKGLELFSLNVEYKYWKPLRRLLHAIKIKWPHYAAVASVEQRLQTPSAVPELVLRD